MDPANTKEDSSIIQSVLAGDTAAYSELVRRYEGRIRRLCVSLLKNETEAEDAAQEVFIKAYQSLRSFRQTSSFYTWLYRIASNHCLSFLRSKKRRPAESLDALLETEGGKMEALFSKSPNPRAAFEATDLIERLLSDLRPHYRLILTLREIEGLSYEEISQVMEISLDAVKAQLRRAREEIGQKMRHFLPDTASNK